MEEREQNDVDMKDENKFDKNNIKKNLNINFELKAKNNQNNDYNDNEEKEEKNIEENINKVNDDKINIDNDKEKDNKREDKDNIKDKEYYNNIENNLNINFELKIKKKQINVCDNNKEETKNKEENNIGKGSEDKINISNDKKKKKNKEDKEDKENIEDEEYQKIENTHSERSVYSLEGGIKPLSLYTRRVMNVSKIRDYLRENSSRGQCGGKNLGNTCFMNSSIACLSNCIELTYYFLKGDYKKDINEENHLGMRGDLAKSWGDLLYQYWVEGTRVGDPSDFKYTIGRKAPIFSGYGQQDSNEFMTIFLDILNEDLNRTTKKQYIEMNEKGDNENDEECARRFWECNLKRNDSIVTDLFCGQFKSTITCPDCGWISITFNPFETINLPLLTQKKTNSQYDDIQHEFIFFYIPKYCLRNPYKITIKNINKNEPINNLINRIKKEENFIYHDKLDELLLVDMYNNNKYGYAEIYNSLSHYCFSNEYLFSFNINKKEDKIKIPIYFFSGNTEVKYKYPRMAFAKGGANLDEIRKKIYFYIRRYILSPFLKENEEKDSLTLEFDKYIKDEKLELNEDNLIELIEKEYQDVFSGNEEEKEKTNEKKGTKMDVEEEEQQKEKKEQSQIIEEEEKDEETKEETKGGNKDYDNEKKNEEKKDGKNEGIKTDEVEENEHDRKYEEKKNKDNKKEEQKNNEEKGKKESKEQNEKEKCIEKFIEDLPFNIYIKREKYDNDIIDFINKEYFKNLCPKFKSLFKLNSFKDTLDKVLINLNDYEIIVKFNKDSKYINKDRFDFDLFDEYSLEYVVKKEEPKKNEEEEEDFKGKMTLEKCLKKFCKEEQLEEGDEWYCSKCKKHVLAKKKMELYYLPKILIICFKRFIKDSNRWEKNDDEVDFPINNMDMRNFVIGPDKEHSKYDLFAVSQHYGSTGFGHYTAVCKNNGKWFSYNDSSCCETNENDAQSSAAYVLFYRRQTD